MPPQFTSRNDEKSAGRKRAPYSLQEIPQSRGAALSGLFRIVEFFVNTADNVQALQGRIAGVSGIGNSQ